MPTPRNKKLPLPGMSNIAIGSEYDPDEFEFLKAILAWRSVNRRHPKMIELLDIARGLGWRKQESGYTEDY